MINIIAGARPNFMKIAPIIRAFKERRAAGGSPRYRLVHTGQHCDPKMSGDSFSQLGTPASDFNLEAGSGTQAGQTAAIMMRYERLLKEGPSRLCLIVGDVNSTMACAISAQKLCISVAHVEAGIRSGRWSMPGEINWRVTGSITNWFFANSKVANDNLRHGGAPDERTFFVGDTMIDTRLVKMGKCRPPAAVAELGLDSCACFVTTLHRPANADGGGGFACLLTAIGAGTRGLPVVFPVHPHTARTLADLPGFPPYIHPIEPQLYLESNYLAKNAKAVIADAGGITEEITVMGILYLWKKGGDTGKVGRKGCHANRCCPRASTLFQPSGMIQSSPG